MTATRTPAVRAVVLTVALALGRLTAAQPAAPDDRAKAAEAAALYDEGKRHFDIGEYAQAITSWKQSYLRSSAPLLLFNIAQAYRLSGNCAQANRFYLNYRRVEKHPRNQAELDKAMARCAGVEPATGDVNEPAVSTTTGSAAATPPTAAPAGPTATGAAPSRPASAPSTVTVPGAATEPPPRPGTASPAPSGAAASAPAAPSSGVPANRVATSPLAAPERPAAGRGWRITGIVNGAAGIVALGAGGLYALAASQDSNTVANSRAGTPYTGDLVATDSHGRTAASRARILAGLGAALAVAGGAMWYIGHRQGAQIDVAIAPGHAEVALSCAF